jgi:hypothetical protein
VSASGAESAVVCEQAPLIVREQARRRAIAECRDVLGVAAQRKDRGGVDKVPAKLRMVGKKPGGEGTDVAPQGTGGGNLGFECRADVEEVDH